MNCEFKFNFDESKRQIIESLYSHELCLYLLSWSRLHDNELLTDIVTFLKVSDSRKSRFKNPAYSAYVDVLTISNYSQSEVVSKQPVSDVNAKQSSQKNMPRYYNCRSFEHISPSSTKSKHPKSTYFKCGPTNHQLSSCPRNQSYYSVEHQDDPSSSDMVL